MNNAQFPALYSKACAAANEAGEKWLAEHTEPAWVVKNSNGSVAGTMLDLCGFAWVHLPKFNTGFARWAKASNIARKAYNGGGTLSLAHHGAYRQEMGFNEARCRAASAVLSEAGVEAYCQSRID